VIRSEVLGILCCIAASAPAASLGQAPENRMSPRTVRVAVCQTFCIDSDRDGNLRHIEYAVEAAAREKAALACFPETAVLGWVNPDAWELAGPIPGPISDRIAQMARRHNLMIAIGLAEKEGDKLYDSAILIGADGRILLKHRKINTLTELLNPPYTRGRPEDIAVVDTPIGRVGMLICADTFIESLVQRAAEASPDLLLVPYGWAADTSAWPDHGKALVETVTRTARWAGCPVVGTDCVGMITHGPWRGKTYGGQSVVADRDGQVLATLRDRDAEVRVMEIEVGRAAAPSAVPN
jgi:predicted amidohydrolase